MNEIASSGQLRASYARWALVTIPVIVVLGYLSGSIAGSASENSWFLGLDKPGFMPSGSTFAVIWTLLYILQGAAIAMILNARNAKGRGLAIGLFMVQFVLSLYWPILFFGQHEVTAALWLLLIIFLIAAATYFLFGRIRRLAGLLMVPTLLWLFFASILNFSIDQRNPDAETLVPDGGHSQMDIAS